MSVDQFIDNPPNSTVIGDDDKVVITAELATKQFAKKYIEEHIKPRSNTNWRDKQCAKEVYDYYHGEDQDSYLLTELQKRFPQSYDQKRRATENITKAIVNHISVVYKSPPKRGVIFDEANMSDAEIDKEKERHEELQEVYDKMVRDCALNAEMQKAERYLEFQRTCLIQVAYLDKSNRMKLKVFPRHMFDVLLDEEGELEMVITSDFYGTTEDEEKRIFTVTTESNRWQFNNDLEEVTKEGMDVNPYGLVNFILLRSFEPDQGVYCPPASTLARVNLNLNLLLCDALHLCEFQTHGQMVMIDCETKKQEGIGPEKPLIVRTREVEDKSIKAQVEFLKPAADFKGLLDTTNRILSGYSSSMGLPPNMFSVEKTGNAESGVSLKIRSAPLNEFRKSREERFRRIEDKILEVMIAVWNANTGNHGLGEMPEDMQVNVVYEEASHSFETPSEMATTMISLLSQNLMKPTDIVMKLNPGMNKRDAEEYIKEVQEEKKGLISVNIPTGPEPNSEESEEDEADDVRDTLKNNLKNLNPNG